MNIRKTGILISAFLTIILGIFGSATANVSYVYLGLMFLLLEMFLVIIGRRKK